MVVFSLAMKCLLELSSKAIGDPDPGSLIRGSHGDDLVASGKLDRLFELIAFYDKIGPHLGIWRNFEKTTILVKKEHLQKAHTLASTRDIRDKITIKSIDADNIQEQGIELLGAPAGSREFTENWLTNEIADWTKEVHSLARFARSEPQAAYAFFTKSTVAKWSYLMRCIRIPDKLLSPLVRAINEDFIPSLFSSDGNYHLPAGIRKITELPCRLGGLAIPNPIIEAIRNYVAATETFAHLIEKFISCASHKTGFDYDRSDHLKYKSKAKSSKAKKILGDQRIITQKLRDNPSNKNLIRLKLIEINSQNGANTTLTAFAAAQFGLTLNRQEFRDMLFVRFALEIPDLPSHCACGKQNNLQHASACRKGGFRIRQHNKAVNVWASLIAAGGIDATNIRKEAPLLNEINSPSNSSPNEDNPHSDMKILRSDIAYDDGYNNTNHLDVTMVNPIAKSHIHKDLKAVYNYAAQAKNRKYKKICEIHNKASFTPLIHNSISGLPQLKAQSLFKDLVQNIANFTDQAYSNVMVAYRARLALAAAKAMSQNLRGNRVRPKSNTSFFHFHNFSETLLAWRIRNNGGDSWSHESLDFD